MLADAQGALAACFVLPRPLGDLLHGQPSGSLDNLGPCRTAGVAGVEPNRPLLARRLRAAWWREREPRMP